MFAARLKHRHHPDIAFDRRDDLPAHATEGYRHGLVPYPQFTDLKPVNTIRQLRPVDTHFLSLGVDRDPKTSLKDHERRSGRPGLRQTRDRIADRSLATLPGEAAEQLGQTHI